MPLIQRLVPAAAMLALALPATARAATLDPLKPCFVSVDQQTREPVPVEASGFTEGGTVDVAIDGTTVRSGVPVLFGGRVSGSVTGPYQPTGERPFTLTVTEEGNPANFASAVSKVTALSLKVHPQEARPRAKVRFSGRGFTSGAPVYAHYLYGGELRRTVRFGVPHGDCGVFSVKRRQIPVKHRRTGRWTLQADTVKAYSENPASVLVRLAITVKRVFRAG